MLREVLQVLRSEYAFALITASLAVLLAVIAFELVGYLGLAMLGLLTLLVCANVELGKDGPLGGINNPELPRLGRRAPGEFDTGRARRAPQRNGRAASLALFRAAYRRRLRRDRLRRFLLCPAAVRPAILQASRGPLGGVARHVKAARLAASAPPAAILRLHPRQLSQV